MFKMHNNKRIMLKLVPGLAVLVGDLEGANVIMLAFSVEGKDVTVLGFSVEGEDVTMLVFSVEGEDVTMLVFSVEGEDVTVVLLCDVFAKVNVPKRLMGLSPLSEPSVSLVIR